MLVDLAGDHRPGDFRHRPQLVAGAMVRDHGHAHAMYIVYAHVAYARMGQVTTRRMEVSSALRRSHAALWWFLMPAATRVFSLLLCVCWGLGGGVGCLCVGVGDGVVGNAGTTSSRSTSLPTLERWRGLTRRPNVSITHQPRDRHTSIYIDTRHAHRCPSSRGGGDPSTVRWFAAVLGHTVTRTLPFWIAGAMLGLGIGAATMWVQVSE